MGCHFEYVPRISLNTWVLTSLKSNVAKFALLTLCEEMQSVISFMAISFVMNKWGPFTIALIQIRQLDHGNGTPKLP
jgi:hypothetical protein